MVGDPSILFWKEKKNTKMWLMSVDVIWRKSKCGWRINSRVIIYNVEAKKERKKKKPFLDGKQKLWLVV